MDLQEESLPWYKVALIILMFMSITMSAMMNIFWMYLIVNQIIRIVNRSPEDLEGDVSQSEDRGSEPSIQGDETGDRTPLMGGTDSAGDRLDTDEERDILHISST